MTQPIQAQAVDKSKVAPVSVTKTGNRVSVRPSANGISIQEAREALDDLLAVRDQASEARQNIQNNWDSATAAQQKQITKQVLLGLIDVVTKLIVVVAYLAMQEAKRQRR